MIFIIIHWLVLLATSSTYFMPSLAFQPRQPSGHSERALTERIIGKQVQWRWIPASRRLSRKLTSARTATAFPSYLERCWVGKALVGSKLVRHYQQQLATYRNGDYCWQLDHSHRSSCLNSGTNESELTVLSICLHTPTPYTFQEEENSFASKMWHIQTKSRLRSTEWILVDNMLCFNYNQ